MKTLLVCPLEIELNPFLERLRELAIPYQKKDIKGFPYYEVPSMKLVCAVGGHGKVDYAIRSQFLISALGPISHFICVGAAGGLAPQVQIRDLVVGLDVLEHDYKQGFDKTLKRPQLSCDPELVGKARKMPKSHFAVHFGTIASGDEDIVDTVRADTLHLDTKALAVAWEGAGGAKAALFNKTPYLEIRTISDNARDNVVHSFRENLPKAMANACDLVTFLLR